MKLSIVIPVYNEKKFIQEIIKRVKNVDLRHIRKEIIIIDDFSTDGTRDILKNKILTGYHIQTKEVDGSPFDTVYYLFRREREYIG